MKRIIFISIVIFLISSNVCFAATRYKIRTEADISDAALTVLGNTSNTNTGDNTVATSGDSATDFFSSGEIADAQISDTLTSSTCTGNAATVTNGVYTTDNISALAASTSAQLYGVLSDETGSASGTPLAVFNQAPAIDGNIKNTPFHLYKTIIDPLSVQTEDNEICLVPETDAALTITNIRVTLDATTNEVAGDVKFADTFIALANATVIETFDTTSGVRSDDAMSGDATIPAGKCIYLSFDSAPNTAIKQMCIEIRGDYD